MHSFNPFSMQKEWKQLIQNPDQLNMNHFLDNFMKQFTISDEIKKNNDSANTTKTFESFDHIYIHVPIENSDNIKVVHTIEQLFVYESNDKIAEVTLPSLVSKNGGSAQIESNILQVRLLKVNDTQSIELNID